MHQAINESDAGSAEVDRACDAFEAAWLAGEQPRIEDVLAHVDEDARTAFLCELLIAEWRLRDRCGEVFERATYLERFPHDGPLIHDLWEDRHTESVDILPDQSEEPGRAERAAPHRVDRSYPASEMECVATDRLVGQTVTHYRIRECLGSGGMGHVYLADDTRLGRPVALKVLSPKFTQDEDRIRRFEREARAASALNHPNIVTVHDIGTSDFGRFIVMERVAGKTIRELTRDPPPMSVIADVGRQIAEALDVAHTAGIVHRDIKPQNVMVRGDGYVKVLDFGLVRLITGADSESYSHGPEFAGDQLSHSNVLVGTASYTSPEQAMGQPATSASDMFSLGIVLYELATGKHPCASGSAAACLHAIVSQTPISPSAINPDVSQELETLILRLLNKDPQLRPRAAQARQILTTLARQEPADRIHSLTQTTRHTVGRERELAKLQTSCDRVAAGRGELVCVSGEPGIGKTTLVEDFLRTLRADRREVHIGHGRCSERLESTEAYLPVLEVLERLVQDNGANGTTVLKSLAPTWYVHVVPLSSSNSSVARIREEIRDFSQDRMKRELAALLGEISRRRPVVLFLDDLHWADSATIELLAYVATKFENLRVLIVATFRPTELLLNKHPFARVKQDLQSRGLCQEIQLEFLSRGEIEQYLALEFPQHRFPREFVDLVHRRTDGSPLFMVDLLRHLRDRGLVAQTDGGWELGRSLPELDGELPESVRSMIGRKIDQLGEADRTLLTVGSVQGHVFDASVVADVVGADPVDVEDQLETVENVHGLIFRIGEQEFPDLTLTVRYQFVHALYQHAFYHALNPGRRAAWSRAVANSLVRMYRDKSSQIAGDLALLFRAGREFDKACDFFVQAADNAAGLAAYRQAASLLTQAVEIAKRLGQEQRLTDLRARRGKALSSAEMWVDAKEDLEIAAADLTEESGTRRTEVLVDLALTCFYLSDGPGIRRFGGQALALAEEAGRNDLAASALHALGYSEYGRLEESVERCERALALDPTNHAPLEQLGRILYWMGRYEEAIMRSRRAAEWCQKTGRTSTGVMALGDLGLSLTAAGRYREAIEVFDQADGLGREFDIKGHRARAMVMRGGLHLHLFDFAKARIFAEEARELARSVGFLPPVVSAGLDLLTLFIRSGELTHASTLVDEVACGVEKGPGAHEWLWNLRFALVQAELAVARADWDQAQRQAESAIEQSRTTRRVKYEVAGLQSRAQSLAAIGRKHEAVSDLRLAVDLARRIGDPVVFLRTAASLLAVEGSDELAAEARQTIQQVTAALPDENLRRAFAAAELVQFLTN